MLKKLPKISVITPSYNQGQYIEQTIKSVLSQNYPYLEYIVIDGGSTDRTLSILKKYKNKLSWTSEKDRGQSDALNKGLKKVTGEIICYLNSDDYFEKNTLNKVGTFFQEHPQAYWLTGKCYIVDEKGREIRKLITLYKIFLLKYFNYKTVLFIIQFISQPATFWRSSASKKIGGFDINLQYSMDYDYWLRLIQNYKLFFLDDYLASYRIHGHSKAVKSPESQFETQWEIIKRYNNSQFTLFLHRMHINLSLYIYKNLLIDNQ